MGQSPSAYNTLSTEWEQYNPEDEEQVKEQIAPIFQAWKHRQAHWYKTERAYYHEVSELEKEARKLRSQTALRGEQDCCCWPFSLIMSWPVEYMRERSEWLEEKKIKL